MAALLGFVDRQHITADVGWADAPDSPSEWDRTANHWSVTLRGRFDGRRRQMTVPFHTGSALGRPEAIDVLDCLLSDASMIENARDFEDFAADLGYDPGSRKAERAYHEIQRQTERLRTFLGATFDSAMEHRHA